MNFDPLTGGFIASDGRIYHSSGDGILWWEQHIEKGDVHEVWSVFYNEFQRLANEQGYTGLPMLPLPQFEDRGAYIGNLTPVIPLEAHKEIHDAAVEYIRPLFESRLRDGAIRASLGAGPVVEFQGRQLELVIGTVINAGALFSPSTFDVSWLY